MMPVPSQRGFTLLEALIAMAIFSIIGLASYRLLSAIITSQEITQQHADRLQTLQRAVMIVDRDMRQWLDRPVRTSGADEAEPSLWLGNDNTYLLQLTRGGWANPLQLPRSHLQRVAYDIGPHPQADISTSPFYQDDQLYLRRHYWLQLDHSDSEPDFSQALLPAVNALQLVVVDDSGIRHSRWPPAVSSANEDQSPPQPRLLEWQLDSDSFGPLLRQYALP